MSDREVQEAVQKLAGRQLADEVFLVECTVTAVDLSTRSCTCLTIGGTGEVELDEVQLMSGVDDGFLLVPELNSTVHVLFSKRVQPQVILYSAVNQVIIYTGNTSLSVKDGLVKLNDGSFGGLVQIQPLVTKINALENLVNDLISKFNTHVHNGVQTGGGVSGIPTVTETQTINPITEVSDLENTLITHGQ